MMSVSSQQCAIVMTTDGMMTVESLGLNPTGVRQAGAGEWRWLPRSKKLRLRLGDELALSRQVVLSGTPDEARATMIFEMFDHLLMNELNEAAKLQLTRVQAARAEAAQCVEARLAAVAHFRRVEAEQVAERVAEA